MWRRLALLVALAGCAGRSLGYEPRVNYQLNCMGCHLADGSGSLGRVPSLRRSLVQLSALPAGRDYIIRVPGVAQSPLTDEETANLLNWMAHNLSDVTLASGFIEYTAAEIARSRRHPLAAVGAARARLLRAAGNSPAENKPPATGNR